MVPLFANQAGQQLLTSLREIFSERRVHCRQDRFFIFVCGGGLETSFRKRFIDWAEHNLPKFICLKAEDAFKDSFAGEGRTFVNFANFESVIADIADCVLIFPESEGSFAETGFFAKSEVGKKTLVVNPLSHQTDESFLNRGPIDTINRISFLQPAIHIDSDGPSINFAPIGERLKARVKSPEHPERLPFRTFNKFTLKHKLLIVFEILRLLRLADIHTLRYVLKACFGGDPQHEQLKSLLRILQAARFIQREEQYFKVVAGIDLVDIKHFEIERIFAQVTLFYLRHSKELYDALLEAT
ncbi:MAG: retron St85 family effector protein [Acidobacteriia bacterium]|nr:retron St85 family effector protein [Terriglobia bacterium]